jgi:hypothetical protein
MTWETTRETYVDDTGLRSTQATRWGTDGAFYLTRNGELNIIKNSNKANTLKEISTRIDEIDEQLGKNPPDDVKQLLTNFRQYLVEIDSDFFNVAKLGYNIANPNHVIPTLTTLYVSNYNMMNQLVKEIQELHKKLETNNETPVGSAYNYVKSKKPPSGGRTRINKKQQRNRKSRKNSTRRLR